MITSLFIRLSRIIKNTNTHYIRKCIIIILCLIVNTSSSHANSQEKTKHQLQKIEDRLTQIPIIFIHPGSGYTKEQYYNLQKKFPTFYKNSYKKSNEPYHAATDEIRFAELKKALTSSDYRYIWAGRGGYGSARLFDGLDNIIKPLEPKILIGYSDITFLHLFLGQKYGWPTIHGAMPFDLLHHDKQTENFTKIIDILTKTNGVIEYDDIVALNYDKIKNYSENSSTNNINSITNKTKPTYKITGEIIGGNLTILANSLGTPWQINGDNKIIFIEDTGVSGYIIDRDLNHLKQAGVFRNAKAILFGEFVNSDKNLEYALKRFAINNDIPVFYTKLFGHGRYNYPLPFGCKSVIEKSDAAKHNNKEQFKLRIDYDFRNITDL